VPSATVELSKDNSLLASAGHGMDSRTVGCIAHCLCQMILSPRARHPPRSRP
jgi:hypothetical protein